MDRFQFMSVFVAVGKAGGFSAAARELGMPLATVSRQVADLEAQLGVRLLRRSTRKVELTEHGKIFHAASRRILEDLREAEASVTGEFAAPRGDLAVTASMAFGRQYLQPVVLEFLAAYPQINLRLVLADRIVNLLEENIDAAVRIAELKDSNLIARPLGQVRVVTCASPAYLARRGAPRHPRELIEHDCITWSPQAPPSTWSYHEAGKDITVPIRVRFATSTSESAAAAAEAGAGLTQAPCYLISESVRTGRLKVVLKEFVGAGTPVHLVYPSQRLLPSKLRTFIEFAAPRLVERLRSNDRMVERSAA